MAKSPQWFAGIANHKRKKKARNRKRRKEAKRHKCKVRK